MNKAAKIGIPVIIAVLLCFLGTFLFKDATYRIDTSNFESTVAYLDEVDVSGLQVVKTKGGKDSFIKVDASMVTECDPTSSVGDKKLKVVYEEQEFVVNFKVKYKVEFVSDSQTLETQYVLAPSEIKLPNDPYKKGFEFDGWNRDIPDAINDNLVFEAVFRDVPKEIPNLGDYNVYYSDTLADIKLPSNDYGVWTFVDPLETTVGDVGQKEFNVKFVPTNPELKVLTDVVTVYVSKMNLDFNFTRLQFDYDGLEHKPEYTLIDSKGKTVTLAENEVVYSGEMGKEVGSYLYAFTINSKNYEGSAMGYFSVSTNKVTITIHDQSMTLGEEIPEITYDVEGVYPETVPLLNIELVIPEIKNAGEYDISAKVNNPNYTDVVVVKGKLTVNKITLGVNKLSIATNPVYGQTLADVKIENDNPYGYWKWEDESIVLDRAGSFTAKAIFIPLSTNYNEEYDDVTFSVAKKQLEISITDDENNPNDGYEYVYDGLEHTITYKVDGFVLGETIDDIEIIGNVVGVNAGNTSSTLEVVSDNYVGKLNVTLVIKPAIPETDFTTVFDDVLLNTKLNQITLPEGYKWDAGSTILNTVGENQQFPVTYTHPDADNYVTVKGFFTVNVIKHTAKITAKDTYLFTYNGEIHELTNVSASHDESELVYKYYLNGNEVENIRNAGEYTVVITLPESDTYYETTLEVKAIVESIGVSPEPISYDAVYGDKLGSITLPTSEYGVWSWKDAEDGTPGEEILVGNAGNRIHVAVFTSNDSNYKSYEVNVTIVVSKKKLEILVDPNDNIHDYDGLEHKIIYSIEDDINVKVLGNTPQINAGTHTINLVIDDVNYQGNIRTDLIINKIDPEVDEVILGEEGEILWNTSASSYNSLLGEGFRFKENYSFDTVGEELEYVLVYTPKDGTNYNVIEVIAKITVSPIDATITYRDTTYIYNGNPITLTASTNNEDVGVELEYVYRLNGQEVTEIKDAGTYSVDIISPASTHYNKTVKTVEVIVDKKEVDVIWNISNSYTYKTNGQTLPKAEFVDALGSYKNLEVTFVDKLNPENTSFKNASTYAFSVVISDELAKNYIFNNVDSGDVIINKATVDTSNATWSGTGFPFDGRVHTVQINNVAWPSDVTVNYVDNAKKEAGNYTAKVSFVYDENNYNTIEVLEPTHEWYISASGLEVIWEDNAEREYTGEEFDLPKAYIYDSNIDSKIYLDVEMDKTTFKDAGLYKFTASTDNSNYVLIGNTTTVLVTKHTLTVDWTIGNYEYTGSELTKPVAKVVDLSGNTVTLEVTISSGNAIFKNAGDYYFLAAFGSYADKDNYILENTTSAKVTIAKATYDMSGAEWDYDEALIYNGSTQSVFVTGLPNGVTDLSYAGNTGTDATTYLASVVLGYDEENYNAPTMDDLAWEIKAKDINVVWSGNEDRIYTGNQFLLPSASFEDLDGNEVSSTNGLLIIHESNGKTFKDADTYTFVASFSNSYASKGNYNIVNSEEIVVSKKDASSDAASSKLEATYGDILDDIELPTPVYGTWSLSSVHNPTDKVGDVGEEHVIYLDFTPKAGYEGNYSVQTQVEFILEVSAYKASVSITPNGGTYAGVITPSIATVTDHVDVTAPTVTLTYTGTANDGSSYNSTTAPTKAGTYTVTATIADTNYILDKTTASFVVAKATPGTYFNTVTFNVKWNTKLEDIDLSAVNKDVEGTYTFDAPTTTLDEVGNGQVFEATFTPADTDNYEVVNDAFVVNVLGGVSATITANDTYTFTYDGNAKTITATGSHTETTLEYVYKLNGNVVDSMVDVGTYSVVITLPGTEHYEVATKTVAVIINKKTVDVIWDNEESYTYSANGQALPKAYITLVGGSLAEINVNEANGNEFKDAGNYTFEASLTGLDVDRNYVLGNNVVSSTIVIQKGNINLSGAKWNYTTPYTYSGSAQSVTVIGVSLPSDVSINYSGNEQTNAKANYSATASLVYESKNYNVTGSLPEALSWTILPKDAKVNWEDVAEREYTSEVFDAPTAYINGVSGRVDLTVDMLTAGSYKNVGSYVFEATDESGNYNLSNTNATVVVSAASLTVNWDYDSYTYTGSELTKPEAYVEDLQGNRIPLTVTIASGGTLFKNAGSYFFDAAFGNYSEKDNYILTNTVSDEVVVAKATFDTEGFGWNYNGPLEYTGNEYTVELIGIPNGVTVDSYSGNTGTDAKTYTASATLIYDSENYNELEIDELTWVIEPKGIYVIWSEEVYEYTGSNLSYPSATYTGITVTVSKSFAGEFKDAGTYKFAASTTNTNYTILNPTKDYVVSKQDVSGDVVNRENLEATYGDKYKDIILPTSIYGTWSLSSTYDKEAKVGNVGEYTIYLDFTPLALYEGNYASQTNVEYKLVVEAFETVVDITPNGGTYGGDIVGSTATVTDHVDAVAPTVTLTYTGTANDGSKYNSTTVPTKAGTYTVTATIADTNYSIEKTTDTFVVARKDANITNTLAASTDYTGSTIDVTNMFTLDHNESSLSYTYKYNGGSIGSIKNAGTYTIVVSAAQSANYNIVSTDPITFVVNKISPNLTYTGETNYTYSSGTIHTINDSDISHDNTDTGYTYTKVIKLDGNVVDSISVAGTYSVSITISGTTNFSEDTYEFSVVVEKGKIELEDITATQTAIYGQTLGDFDLPEATLEGGWSWKEGNSTVVGDVGSRVHVAVYTPTDTSLAEEEREITFTVNPKPITITTTSAKTFVYDSNEKTITYSLSETPAGVEVATTGTVSATVVGEYSVTFTITGNSNYTGTLTVAWSITKATPTYETPTGLEATYGDKLSSVSLSAFDSLNGTWKWENTDPTATVGNAGTRSHNAVFTPTDTDNYKVVTIAVSITVAKQEYTPDVIATAATATYGDKLSSVSLEGSNSMGEWVWTNPTAVVGDAGTNEISITFDLNDKNNYYVANTELVSVTVNPKDITVVFGNLTHTYGNVSAASVSVKGNVEGIVPTVTLTYTGTANDGTVYDGVEYPTKAGAYPVTASITDGNYNLTGTIVATFTINKADPNGSFSVSENTFEWGKTLGELGLDYSSAVEGVATWDDGDAYKPEVTAGASYTVKFTPTDEANYNVDTDSITLVVNRVTTSITTPNNVYEYTYGDLANFLSSLGDEVAPNNNEQTIKYYIGEDEVTSIENAGTYVVLIKVAQTAHYKESSTTVTIKVAKKEEDIVVATEYEYGSTMNNVNPQLSEFGEQIVHETDPSLENQVALFSTRSSSALLGAAGDKKTVWIEFIPHDQYEHNYAHFIKEVVLTVVQKKVSAVIVPNGGEFNKVTAATATLEGILDGEIAPEITLTYTGTANDGTEYHSTEVPSKAGKYTVTASISAANYVLTDGLSADFEIEKATPVYVDHTFEAYWNEKTSDYPLTSMVAKDPNTGLTLAGEFTWKGVQTFENVGDGQEFEATFTPNDENNYNVVNNVVFTVDVNRIATTLENYETSLAGLVYKQDQKVYVQPVFNHSEGTPVISIIYKGLNNAGNTTVDYLSNAGYYSITVTMAETAHYEEYVGTPFSVYIEQATPETNFNTVLDSVVWKDDLTLANVNLPSLRYTWDAPTTNLDSIETKAYAATFTPTNTVNYKTVKGEFNVTVIKADGEVSADASYEFVYKHSEYTVNDLTNVITNHKEEDLIISAELLNAGTYEITITLPASTHYNEATTTTTVTIKKAVEPKPDDLTAPYGTELGNVTLPTSENGTWSVKSTYDETTVYDAGTHEITLTFTASTNNYETKDYTVNLIITPVAYPHQIDVPEGLEATYGDKLSSVSFSAHNVAGGTWSWKDTRENTLVGVVGEQTHKAIFTPTSKNYVSSEHDVVINVNKKELTFTNVKDEFNFDTTTHYVTYDLEGILTGDSEPEVTGNVGLRNVGSKDYTLEVNDDNYKGTHVGTIEVKPVDPEVNFEAIVVTGTYGETLDSIDLSAYPGYSFAQNNQMNIVGEGQKFAATYTHPTEGSNYNTMPGTITVNVVKAEYDLDGVAWSANSFVYDGYEKTVTLTGLPSSITNVVYANNANTAAGNYTATVVSFDYDEEHYEKPDLELLSHNWVIEKSGVDVVLDDVYEYGTTLDDVKPKASNYGTFEVTNKDVDYVSGEVLGNAGDKVTLLVTFTSTNANYKDFVEEVEITIAQAEVTFDIIKKSFEYNKSAHSVQYTLGNVVSGETVTIDATGDVSATNVGNYTVTLSVVGNDNYKGSTTVEWDIYKAEPDTDFSKVYTVEVGTELGTIELPEGYSWVENKPLYKVEDGQQFAAIYTPDDTDNYKVVEGMFTVNVTLIKTTVNINSSSWTDKTYEDDVTYSVNATLSSEVEPTITIGYNSSTTASESDSYADPVDNLSNAGTYKITVTADGTAIYSAVNEVYYVVIKQKSVAAFNREYPVTWKEGLTLANSGITLEDGYTWKDSSMALGNATTYDCAVIYTPLTEEDRINHLTEEGIFKVKVNKAKGTITANETYTFDYDSNAKTITATANHQESTLEYAYTLAGNKIDSMVNAGTYSVTITLPASDHYDIATKVVEVVINQVKVSLPTGLTATYGQTLGDVVLPTSKYGTWSWVSANTTKVGNVGTVPHEIKFTPFEQYKVNYQVVQEEVNITVNKQITTVTPSIPSELVYDGGTFDHTSWFETNSTAAINYDIVYTTTSTKVTNIVNAGEYEISVSVNESDNFTKFDSKVYTVTIKQTEYTQAVTTPSGLTATYGDTLSSVSLENFKVEGDNGGTWSWIIANGENPTVGNAGTSQANARFTPTNTNYAPFTRQLSITVAKKQLSIVVTQDEFEYNGQAQCIIYEIKDGDNEISSTDFTSLGITVNGNISKINVGDYEYTLSLASNNYQATSVTGIFSITPATTIITLPTPTGTFYEDRLDTVNLTSGATAVNSEGITVPGNFTYKNPTYSGNAATSTVSVEVTFESSDPNYSDEVRYINITLSPVAKVGSLYYGTVDEAIRKTGSGTIEVIPGTNPIIKSSGLKIAAGVTLFLPHTSGNSVKGNSDGTAEYHSDGSMNDAQTQFLYTFESPSSNNGAYDGGEVATSLSNRLKSTLYIASGITLTNNGTIEIAGQLSGGGGGSNFAGQTYGYYSRIVLKSSAHIESNGTINCYGYIEEESLNNGSSITVNNGGLVYMPYILRDFRGGSYMYAVYRERDKKESSPFNQFEFRNITSTIRYNYGSSLKGWANLYAGSKQNFTSVDFMGTTSSSFIQMTNATYSYAISKFNPNTEVTKFDIYGGASTSSIKLEVKVLGTITLDTTDYYFPLSYRFNISLNKAEGQTSNAKYSMPQKFKLLPGSELKVNQGAELSLGSLIIYESWVDDCGGFANAHPNTSPARFIIDGKVTATNLAGTVLTTGTGAELNVTNSSTITSYEPTGSISGSSLMASVSAWKNMSYNLKAYIFNGTSVNSRPSSIAKGTYYSQQGGWYSNNITIYYNANGGVLTGGLSESIDASPYTIVDINTSDPTKNYYTFDEWYLDIECTIPANEQTLYVSTEVFAKWIPINYSIDVIYKYDENFANTENTYDISINHRDNVALPDNPTNGPANAPYVFGGWYTDEALTNRVYYSSEIDFDTNMSNGKIVLYALWYKNGTPTYEITYVNSNIDYVYFQTQTISYIIVDDVWPAYLSAPLTNWDSNKGESKYFGGWMKPNGTVIESLGSDLFAENEYTLTLTAIWLDKNAIDLTATKYDYGIEAEKIEETIYYIPNSNVTIPLSYLPRGYAYTATLVNNSNNIDITLGTAFSTNGYSSTVSLIIEMHNILTVTCEAGTSSEIGSYYFNVSKYVNENNKIIENTDGKGKLTNKTGTLLTVCGSTATVYLKSGASWCTVRIYKNGASVKEIVSLVSKRNGTYTEEVTGNVTYKVNS